MRVYETVFHPIWFAAGMGLAIVVLEWHWSDRGRHALLHRLGVYGAATVAGTAPAAVYLVLTPARIGTAFVDPTWKVDLASAVGVLLAVGVLWGTWRLLDWGDLVPGIALTVFATLVPYAIVAPFWNISGHVVFTATPVLYLLTVDRRSAPLVLVPGLLVVNRLFLGRHTLLQSVGGLVLAIAVVGLVTATGVTPARSRGSGRRPPESG